MWLTSKENPLTARTMVNRVWEQLFGNGLAETLEDMGTQGIPPTHQELLDWLSWKFMNDYKWSVKKLLKEIVMSATYRQDSKVTPESLEKDPSNKLYGRGTRVRLSAEQVRDQGLCISGLMSEKMYGPSVYPISARRDMVISLEWCRLGKKVKVKINIAVPYILIGNEQLPIHP